MDLIDSIKADLGLDESSYIDDSDSSIEKEALSIQVFEDPLAQEIHSYLSETEEEYTISSVSDSFDFIDKQAGEKVVPDDFRQFVLQAEVAGFDRSEIEDFIEKQAGILGLGRFNSLLRKAKGQKRLLGDLTPGFHDMVAAEAKGINKAPGLVSRVREVFDPGYAAAKRAVKEQALVSKINQLGATNAGMASQGYTSPVLQQYLTNQPATKALKSMYTTPKAPIPPIVNTAGMNDAQRFAHTAANKMLEFKRSKVFKPSMYGAGGLGLGAALIGGGGNSNNRDGRNIVFT